MNNKTNLMYQVVNTNQKPIESFLFQDPFNKSNNTTTIGNGLQTKNKNPFLQNPNPIYEKPKPLIYTSLCACLLQYQNDHTKCFYPDTAINTYITYKPNGEVDNEFIFNETIMDDSEHTFLQNDQYNTVTPKVSITKPVGEPPKAFNFDINSFNSNSITKPVGEPPKAFNFDINNFSNTNSNNFKIGSNTSTFKVPLAFLKKDNTVPLVNEGNEFLINQVEQHTGLKREYAEKILIKNQMNPELAVNYFKENPSSFPNNYFNNYL